MSRCVATLVCVVLGVCGLGVSTLGAQPVSKGLTLDEVNRVFSRQIMVRYQDGAGVWCEASGCVTASNAEVDPVNRLVAAGATAQNCYGLPREVLLATMRRAELASGQRAPDLTQCVLVTLPEGLDAVDIEGIKDGLAKLRGVDEVDMAPQRVAAPLGPDLSGEQWHLERNGGGMGFRAFWSTYGVYGEGVRIVDIEGNFDESHEDLGTAREAHQWIATGTPLLDDAHTVDHGTASLGMIMAEHNGFGVDGLAPGAEPIFAADVTYEYLWGTWATVARALQHLSAGDVMLLEVQMPGPRYRYDGSDSQFGMVPCEYNRANFDAIRIASDIGVIVVEAAGNGEQDLNDPIYEGRFNRSERNSGALVVCAGNPISGDWGEPTEPMYFTNRGTRCDVQAYGAEVWTTISSGNPPYMEFGGTSAASPQVAGAAVLLSALAQSQGRILSPSAMRRLLRDTGEPQSGGDNIGPLIQVRDAGGQIQSYVSAQSPPSERLPRLGQRCDGDGRCEGEGLVCRAIEGRESYCLPVCDPYTPSETCGFFAACELQLDGVGMCANVYGVGVAGDACNESLNPCAVNHLCTQGVCEVMCRVSDHEGCGSQQHCESIGIGFGEVGRCAAGAPEVPEVAPEDEVPGEEIVNEPIDEPEAADEGAGQADEGFVAEGEGFVGEESSFVGSAPGAQARCSVFGGHGGGSGGMFWWMVGVAMVVWRRCCL